MSFTGLVPLVLSKIIHCLNGVKFVKPLARCTAGKLWICCEKEGRKEGKKRGRKTQEKEMKREPSSELIRGGDIEGMVVGNGEDERSKTRRKTDNSAAVVVRVVHPPQSRVYHIEVKETKR